MKRIDLVVFIFFLAVSVFALRNLWGEGFYTSHDGSHQIARLFYFDKLIREGQIPPRWVDSLQNGYGYPLFIFSYQLPWIIAEPIFAAGISIFDSIKLTFFVGYFLSALTMYLFLKRTTGRLPALVGAFLYIFAPFRFSNIFVRAAIGDATAFIFPPLIFLSLYELKVAGTFSTKWIVVGAFSLACLLLSHAMIFAIFAAGIGLYSIVSLFNTQNKRQFIISVTLMAFLGLGMAGYYFIPSSLERKYTKFSETVGPALVGNTFLSLKDLLYSRWGYGVFHSVEGAMSLQLGIPQWLGVFGALFVLLSLWRIRKKQLSAITDICFWLGIFGLSIFLMLPPSLSVWKFASKYFIIDYTFRILSLSVFVTAYLTAVVVRWSKFPRIVALLFILLALYGNRNHQQVNQWLDWPLSLYLDVETTTNTYQEYTPKWVNTNYVRIRRPKVEFTGRNAEIVIAKKTSKHLAFEIDVKEAGDAIINAVNYPGWQYYVNGIKNEFTTSGDGVIKFWLEPGTYHVEAKWNEMPVRRMANIVTMVSLATALGLLCVRKKQSV